MHKTLFLKMRKCVNIYDTLSEPMGNSLLSEKFWSNTLCVHRMSLVMTTVNSLRLWLD